MDQFYLPLETRVKARDTMGEDPRERRMYMHDKDKSYRGDGLLSINGVTWSSRMKDEQEHGRQRGWTDHDSTTPAGIMDTIIRERLEVLVIFLLPHFTRTTAHTVRNCVGPDRIEWLAFRTKWSNPRGRERSEPDKNPISPFCELKNKKKKDKIIKRRKSRSINRETHGSY